MSKPFRIAVIGGGVLGVSIAYTLKRSFKNRVDVILIEKHDQVGQETSKFNSGVLHSGIHSDQDSLKAKFARKGNVMAKEFCKENNVPFNECGMLILAAYKDIFHLVRKSKSFIKIYNNGLEQDIPMQILMPWDIPNIEPHIHGAGAIFIPSVAVVDQVKFVQAIFEKAKQLGVRGFLGKKVSILRPFTGIESNKYNIVTNLEEFLVDGVINAAGLYADEVAKLAGFNQYKIYPYRGEYYEVLGKEAELVNRLVYPVPIEGYPGKGIHFLKTTDERLLIGPNARLVPSKDYYEEDKTPVDVFRDTAVRFCSELKNAEFRWAYSGIRAKITKADDLCHDPDFIFSVDNKSPFLLNIIGYESPGLSGALAAAEYVRNLLDDYIKSR